MQLGLTAPSLRCPPNGSAAAASRPLPQRPFLHQAQFRQTAGDRSCCSLAEGQKHCWKARIACSATRDDRYRERDSSYRQTVEPEVMPQQERQQWGRPTPPPPPPPPPGYRPGYRRARKVGQMQGFGRRELLTSLGVVLATTAGFQAVKGAFQPSPPVSMPAPDLRFEMDESGRRLPRVMYINEGLFVRRFNGAVLKVQEIPNRPYSLVLTDVRSGERFRIDFDDNGSKVDINQQNLMNNFFQEPGWELGLKRVR